MINHGKFMGSLAVLCSLVIFPLLGSSPCAGIMTKNMADGRSLILEGAELIGRGRVTLMEEYGDVREMKVGMRERGEREIVEGEKLVREGGRLMADGDKSFSTQTLLRGRDLMLEGGEMMIRGQKKLLQIDLTKKWVTREEGAFKGQRGISKGEGLILRGMELLKR